MAVVFPSRPFLPFRTEHGKGENMEKCVKLGVIGLGQRGSGMISTPLLPFAERGEVAIVAVCDPLTDRVKAAADKIEEAGQPRPFETSDYREVLARADVDAVFVAVSWEAHVEVAVAAMLAGKPIGLEAGGAYSLEDCYRLVQVYEQTGTELMFMENCCYGKRELMALNMVRRGVLGHVMHCNGAYSHDLREEILGGKENRHYRLRNYIHRNGENYPTHEIGPIAKLLDINNGNRFISLSSFASASRGLHEYAVEKKGAEHPLSNVDFAQGDVVTTVLTCSGGQTVTLTLNTTLPHAYSRRFEVHGTKGMYMEDNDSLFLDNCEEHRKNEWDWRPQWGNAASYEKEYMHPLWEDGGAKDAHGGIDHLVFAAFLETVRTGAHAPIDVYDAATYMCITTLSENSIACGGAPQPFPDFTNGKWTMRSDISDNAYTLDRIDNGADLYFVDRV